MKQETTSGCQATGQPAKPLILRRHWVVFFASTACFLMFLLRYNLSVAIVAIQDERIECEFDPALNKSTDPFCTRKKYDFDRYTFAQFLAAYFYSYSAFQLPTARLSEHFGCAKELIGYGILGSGLITLLTPWMLDLGVMPFMIARMLIGVLHASALCCSYTLYGEWLSKERRQLATTWVNVGFEFGGFVSFFLTGWISSIEWLGWRYAFYLFSLPAIVWFIPYHFMVYSTPDQDPNLSDYERHQLEQERKAQYLLNSKEESESFSKKLIKVPPKFSFKIVMTSAPVWASLVSKFAYGFGYYVITIKLPDYLSEIFHVPIKENGLYSAAPFAGVLISKLICLKLSDIVIGWNVMSLTNVRKLFNSISLFVPAICLFLITVKNDNRDLDILLIFLSMLGTGMVCGGDYAITAEFAGQLSGSIFGLTNTLSVACGFIAPMMTSFVLENVADKLLAWNIIFYSAVVVYLIGGIAFLIWATAEPQPWAQSTFKVAPERHESVSRVVVHKS